MPDKLDDISGKLGRALQHVESFKRAAKSFFETKFYTARIETHDDGRKGTIVVDRMDPIPPDLGILISDAAHQLRSTLDHLMWMLAWPVGKREGNNVQFPITFSLDEFDGRSGSKGVKPLPGTWHQMPRVAHGVRAVVESLQPYNCGKSPGAEYLGYLRCISNWDKHRTLMTSAANVRVVDLGLTFHGSARLVSHETFQGILKPGAVLGSIEVAYGETRGEVHVQPNMTLVPVFDDGMPEEIRGKIIGETLVEAGIFIENTVVPALDPFL